MVRMDDFDEKTEETIVLLFDSAKDMQHFLKFLDQELSIRKLREGKYIPSYGVKDLPCEIDCLIFKLSFCVKDEMSFVFWDILIKHKKSFPKMKYVIGEYK